MESYIMNDHRMEVEQGARFEFGLNWSKFLKVVDENRLARAEQTLQKLLAVEDLRSMNFLDIGCGIRGTSSFL
jgi:2-polyprenyl-6-hydroxyphenyl methylase/3-demethylubiquinone-9 3-methyltransferase